jgi:hypothetical protein
VKIVLLIICGIKSKTLEVNWYCASCVWINVVLVQSYEVTLYFALHMF